MSAITRLFLFAFTTILLASTSWGAEDSAIMSSSIYTSEVAAVKAAADSYNPRSITEDRKYMGAILLEDGNYRYTVSAGDVGADRVSLSLTQSDLANVVAFWRTEGKQKAYPSYFTATDTDTVNRRGRALYLAGSSGALKIFQPKDRTFGSLRADSLGYPVLKGYALGEDVRDVENQIVRVSTEAKVDGFLISQQP